MEYWLVDAKSGNAQGCYLSLDDALQAAEIEAEGQAIDTLSLLAMGNCQRVPQGQRSPRPRRRVFVRFDLGGTEEP